MVHGAAQILRSARALSGLTQSELARRAEVAQPVISVYENGRREPGLSMLAKLVEAAGCELVVDVHRVDPRVRCLPDTPLGRRLRRRRKAVLAAASQRGASNVRVFGSVARGDDTAESDIDLLVDLDDDVSLVGLIGLERELAEILDRRVDVIPARNVKPEIAKRVFAEAVEL